jgi:hypothetical protein
MSVGGAREFALRVSKLGGKTGTTTIVRIVDHISKTYLAHQAKISFVIPICLSHLSNDQSSTLLTHSLRAKP